MAVRRPLLCVVAVALSAAWLMAAPTWTFAGTQSVHARQARVATHAASEICEVFVTNPSVGMRTRMSVTPETTVDSVISEAREAFGFDQDWISDSDFKVYLKEDESTPISGKMGEYNLRPWGPDGLELHIFFEPSR
eukprot:CAMPEP_0171094794 /NCGR_PEP_ID=MMETSP0766_2-20121228/42378_1 /TAXON_ID=439317 /ORGANISM="Gambierdiscus australes, Strain CAWD 149" /LENGTH=135 /DNA_ID=CAMNT_0011553511 /DNA_START=64 /DNA_END=471 /DNA_ORIENTATION=+